MANPTSNNQPVATATTNENSKLDWVRKKVVYDISMLPVAHICFVVRYCHVTSLTTMIMLRVSAMAELKWRWWWRYAITSKDEWRRWTDDGNTPKSTDKGGMTTTTGNWATPTPKQRNEEWSDRVNEMNESRHTNILWPTRVACQLPTHWYFYFVRLLLHSLSLSGLLSKACRLECPTRSWGHKPRHSLALICCPWVRKYSVSKMFFPRGNSQVVEQCKSVMNTCWKGTIAEWTHYTTILCQAESGFYIYSLTSHHITYKGQLEQVS